MISYSTSCKPWVAAAGCRQRGPGDEGEAIADLAIVSFFFFFLELANLSFMGRVVLGRLKKCSSLCCLRRDWRQRGEDWLV